MRVALISLTLIVIIGSVRGEAEELSAEKELDSDLSLLQDKEDPLDPEEYGVYTLFDKEEESGRRERKAIRRSLYKIIRKKLKSDSSRTSQRGREKRSLYKIVRNKSRRPNNWNKKPAVPRPDTETEEKPAVPRPDTETEESVIGNERRKKGMDPGEQEATSKESVKRKVGEEKRDCLTDPTEQGATREGKDIPSGGRYRRSRS